MGRGVGDYADSELMPIGIDSRNQRRFFPKMNGHLEWSTWEKK